MNRKSFFYQGTGLVVLDVLAFLLAAWVSGNVVFSLPLPQLFRQHYYFIAFLFVIIALNFHFFDTYYTLKDFRRLRQVVNLFIALGVSFFISFPISFFDGSGGRSRPYLFLFFFIILCGTALNRVIYSLLNRNTVVKRAVFIGITDSAFRLNAAIRSMRSCARNTGIEVVGYVSCPETEKNENREMPCLGDVRDLEAIIRDNNISLLIYARGSMAAGDPVESVVAAKLKGVELISVGVLFSAITGQIPYEDLDEAWLIEECLRGNKFAQVKLKRSLDMLIGTACFLIFLPVMAILAVLVKIESRGPAFFLQDRIGRFGKPFKIIKIRSMAIDTVSDGADTNNWYTKNVQRITKVGMFLRRTHLDEIPQFINVIKGDMSIVGPRPEMEMYIRECQGIIPFYKLRLSMRPGLTGWAQVWYYHTSTLEGYKAKFRYDLFYLANLSLKLDIEIMARTLLRVSGYPWNLKFREGK